MQAWGKGQFTDENTEMSLRADAFARGEFTAYQRVRELTWTEVKETIDDED